MMTTLISRSVAQGDAPDLVSYSLQDTLEFHRDIHTGHQANSCRYIAAY